MQAGWNSLEARRSVRARRPAAGAFVLVVVLVTTAVLVAGASAAGRERGVSATEIVIGTSAPLSGPAAAWGAVAKGIEAYLKHINDQGGIHGRKIRFEIRDDAYLPPRAVANVRELVDRVGVFAVVGLIGTANAAAVRDYMFANDVLWITPAVDANLWVGQSDLEHLFVTYPNYFQEAKILARHAVEQLGAQRIAVFFQNDGYGRTGLEGVKAALAEMGLSDRLVSEMPYELTETDVGVHALRMQQSGTDTVIIYATPRHGALIAAAIARLGWNPHKLATFTLADPVMYRLAGAAWEGMIIPSFLPFPGTDPAADAVLEILVRNDPSLAQTPFNALAGVAFIEPLLEALRRAGPNLTQEGFVRAMESLQAWNGQLLRQVTFSPSRRQGINALFLAQARGGEMVRISDWIEYPVEF